MLNHSVRFLSFVLYIGPDVLMPVASAIAAVVGVILMFWRRTVGFVQRVAGAIGRLFGRP